MPVPVDRAPGQKIASADINAIAQLLNQTELVANNPEPQRDSIDFNEQAALPKAPVDGEKVFAIDVEGISSLRLISPTGLVTDILQDDSVIVENRSGATIPKGTAVYQSGVSAGAYGLPPVRLPQIAPARSDISDTMPCMGITMQDIAHNNQGRVMTEGILSGVNTSMWPTNTRLYVSKITAGALTDVPVAPPEVDQWVATVLRSHASAGQLFVVTQTAIDAGMPSGYAMLDANSKLYDYQVKYPTNSGAALPTAGEALRGQKFLLLGGAGVPDTLHVCLKTAADTYTWVRVATG